MPGLKKDMLFRFLGDSKSLERAAQRAERSIGEVGGKVTTADRAFAGLTRGAVKAAGMIGGAFAAGQIVSGISDAVGAASDLEESVNAVRVATGGSADEILQFGQSAAQTLGMSRREVNETAVSFSAFNEKIGGGSKTFEDYITRAADFASVMNLDMSEALEKFRSGLAGETEPLRAFGLDLSAAAVEAYALENGLADSKSEMDEAIKVQARYGLLMEQTAKTAGDFANTSDGLANQQRILNAEWENAQAAIGEVFLPLLTDLAPGAVNAIENIRTSILKWRKDMIQLKSLYDFLPGISDTPYATELMASIDAQVEFTEALRNGVGAADAMAAAYLHLYESGNLNMLSLDDLQQALGSTDEQMAGAAQAVRRFAEDSGAGADEIRRLTLFFQPYIEALRESKDASKTAGESYRDQLFELEGLTGGMDDAAPKIEDVAEETRNLSDEMRELTDPVFRAKEAAAEFSEVLKRVQEDGEITADELDELAEASLAVKAAEEGVTAENIEAYGDVISEVAALVGAKTDEINEALGGISGNTNLETLKDIADRFERMGPIQIDLSSLKVATQADIENAVTNAIYQLQRSGTVVMLPV